MINGHLNIAKTFLDKMCLPKDKFCEPQSINWKFNFKFLMD